ncbi:MAG: hypothetical protein SGPRY_014329, partial [Prymnesium sp.]
MTERDGKEGDCAPSLTGDLKSAAVCSPVLADEDEMTAMVIEFSSVNDVDVSALRMLQARRADSPPFDRFSHHSPCL